MYRKYTSEEKIQIVEGYINGEYSWEEKAHALGYNAAPGCFKRWHRVYQEQGPMGLFPTVGNNTYTKEFKEMVVEQYLDGVSSAVDLAAKYKISSADILLRWSSFNHSSQRLFHTIPLLTAN